VENELAIADQQGSVNRIRRRQSTRERVRSLMIYPDPSRLPQVIPAIDSKRVKEHAVPNTLGVPVASRDVANVNDEFAVFYEQTASQVFRTIRLTTGDRNRAEDAMAEAFTRALAKWGKVSRHPNKRAWVTRVAINYDRSCWRQVGQHESPTNLSLNASEATSPPDHLSEELQAALVELQGRQREIVVLRYFSEFELAEIATILCLSKSTVRVHHMRAMRTLRGLLDPEGKSGAPTTKEHQR
jgi:RNA polymerase sigma factor (sigma-70 family)